jgi:hypothetical protein
MIVGGADAQPVVVESDWTLLRTIDFTSPVSACLNEVDGGIYVGRRGTSSDGLYIIDKFGLAVRIAAGSNTAAIEVQPDSGHVFQSEDYGGIVYRTALGATGRQTWVSGFHSGDDDPIGMAFAPANYAGAVLAPGEALVVDRGNAGPDEVWRWSPFAPEGEILVHPDDGTLVDAVDIAIDSSTVLLVDANGTGDGIIYELGADSSLTPFVTTTPIADPSGIVFDPMNGDLLVRDPPTGSVVRIDRTSGDVTDVVTGLSTGFAWAGVDISEDGRQLLITDYGANQIHLLGRCDATAEPELDCNGNGLLDACDIALGTALDCNRNGVPDSCDVATGTSEDCNLDDVPDECPICPPVELVFIMDTSTSMNDEAEALCASTGAVIAYLDGSGVEVQPRLLGICNTPGGAYDCLEDHVANLLGTAVPGSPPAPLDTLGDCPGGNEVCLEDWGLATAVVAGAYSWLPEGESIRLIIPLSDEGPWCGDPVTQNDLDAIAHAISVARDAGVIASPITGSGSSGAVLSLAQALADSTGGIHFSSTTASTDIAQAIVELVLSACASFTDCNNNQVLDECDISSGYSSDDNGDGIPDECQSTPVGDSGPPPALFLAQNVPNPFNPATVIRYELPKKTSVFLGVYSVKGELVRVLVSARKPAGVYEVTWDGRGEGEEPLASGVYFYRMKVGTTTLSKKLVLLK